jgi:very-short-patch-repair endonuclease
MPPEWIVKNEQGTPSAQHDVQPAPNPSKEGSFVLRMRARTEFPSREGSGVGFPDLESARIHVKRKIIPYNPKLTAYAKKLRKNMKLAEVLLWNQLKQKKMLGCDFDRQRPIDEYIVDFYCKDLALALEADGRSHDYKKERDEQRQKRLESLGVRFLRFWEYEIKNDMQSVLMRIETWIRANE